MAYINAIADFLTLIVRCPRHYRMSFVLNRISPMETLPHQEGTLLRPGDALMTHSARKPSFGRADA